ncbi:T9SS type A sorting domain-containing protein [bacterium]|nr:T9SS type A sorting domain-containing protein [bacterium]
MKKRLMILLLGLAAVNAFSAVKYTLRVLDQQVIGTDFYFKVYLQSTDENLLYLASSQIVLDYNEDNFTSDFVARVAGTGEQKIRDRYTIATMPIVNNRIVIDIDAPTFGDQTDFDDRVILISTSNPGSYIGQFKVSTISNTSGTAGLAWYYTTPEVNGTDISYFDNSSPWNAHHITSGNYTNVDPADQSLPVQISSLLAVMTNREGMEISWTTQSEVNSSGFFVWRSSQKDGVYQKLNLDPIPSGGNSSSEQDYSFRDASVKNGQTYWYKIEEVSITGQSEFFGPISVLAASPVPDDFDLTPTYPNPFNSGTSFRYAIPEDSRVRIAVYTLLGAEIMELVDRRQEAGYYELGWNGTDVNGRGVPTGVYFLRMEADGFSKIQKMTLIR